MAENLDIEKLIHHIETHPAIWDMRHEDYSSKIKKKNAWEQLTNAFLDEDSDGDKKREMGTLLQKKWKNIRDRYSRELSERKGKSGQGGKRKTPYMYQQHLRFLSDVMKNRTTDSSLDNEKEPSPSPSIMFESPTRENENATVESVFPRRKKIKKDTVEAKLIEALEANSIRQKKEESELADDDRFFLLSLSPTMKLISPHLKFAARMDIMQTINKYLPQNFQSLQPPIQSNPHASQPSSQQDQSLLHAPHQLFCQEFNPHGLYGFQSGSSIQRPNIKEENEPQPGPSGMQQAASPLMLSPSGSNYSQVSSDKSLF